MGIFKYENHVDFLEQLARKSGRLLKGGEPDIASVAKMVLNDWQRGKLPYFVPPIGCMKMPKEKVETDKEEVNDDDAEEMEEVEAEDEDLEMESDTETAETPDNTEFVDPLFENVRFAKEEQEDRVKAAEDLRKANKEAKAPVDLRELVKQDLKKLTTSIDFFDEEKYESGKKRVRKVKAETSTSSRASSVALSEAPETSNASPASADSLEKTNKPAVVTTSKKRPREPEDSSASGSAPAESSEKADDAKTTETSKKRSRVPEEGQGKGETGKKVKTGAGTFSVSSE